MRFAADGLLSGAMPNVRVPEKRKIDQLMSIVAERPMPEAAPVTMAVLPEISIADDLLRRRGAIAAPR
jgi:hypothetical protein